MKPLSLIYRSAAEKVNSREIETCCRAVIESSDWPLVVRRVGVGRAIRVSDPIYIFSELFRPEHISDPEALWFGRPNYRNTEARILALLFMSEMANDEIT